MAKRSQEDKYGIILFGAEGRMGKMVRECIDDDESCQLILGVDVAYRSTNAPFVSPGTSLTIGQKLLQQEKGMKFSVIDFSNEDGAKGALEFALQFRVDAAVFATTSLPRVVEEKIQNASKEIPISHMANYSIGAHLQLALVAEALKKVPGWQVEISEIHHDKKADSPSGTAAKLADTVDAVGGRRKRKYGRKKGRIGPRDPDEMGIHTVRAGDVVGEHTVMLFGTGERLIIEHRVHTRLNFAAGALLIAKKLCGKPPRMYKSAQPLFE